MSYISVNPEGCYNGFCEGCEAIIYSDRYSCPKGDFCLDCAIDLGYVCSECLLADCMCHPDSNEVQIQTEAA